MFTHTLLPPYSHAPLFEEINFYPIYLFQFCLCNLYPYTTWAHTVQLGCTEAWFSIKKFIMVNHKSKKIPYA